MENVDKRLICEGTVLKGVNLKSTFNWHYLFLVKDDLQKDLKKNQIL